MTHEDQTDSSSGVYCVRVNDVVSAAKLAYYTAKLIKTLIVVPVPPP